MTQEAEALDAVLTHADAMSLLEGATWSDAEAASLIALIRQGTAHLPAASLAWDQPETP